MYAETRDPSSTAVRFLTEVEPQDHEDALAHGQSPTEAAVLRNQA